jgi:lipoprotein-anchoring transpeptidase ErfK/SrfK
MPQIHLGFICLAGVLALTAPAAANTQKSGEAVAHPSTALEYLEKTSGKSKDYLRPSEIDRRYNIALYVNASGRGPNAQRMWVLQRDAADGKMKFAMWDKKWWKSKRAKRKYKLEPGQQPPFSWLVSTGYRWPGNRKSGPTSLGVFAIDERKGRTQRGWHTHGMIHVMYIDYHYSSGRRSGIAFHGTTRGQYRRLGSIASHGCIRMHQSNALNLLKRIKGWDKVLPEDQRWGEVPRFWKREKYSRRYGYVRDGSLLTKQRKTPIEVAEAELAIPAGDTVAPIESLLTPQVLTKKGYRAVAIIFKDPN